jgi:cytochrome P450
MLGGRAATLADLPQLPYTLMVIKEAMRLEPTVALIPRFLLADTHLGGYRLRQGGALLLAVYLLHHDPRWWPQPERFDPTRFSTEYEPNIPDYVYLPFGGGPRICIGNQFALMEAQILLALFASRWQFSVTPGARARPVRQVTTAPQNGLRMRLSLRNA